MKPKPNYQLQNARKARGWTQAMLAEKINSGLSTVRSWENGTREPGVVHRAHLARLFDLSPEALGFTSNLTNEPLAEKDQSAQMKQEMAPTLSAQHVADSLIEQPHKDSDDDKNRQRMIKRVEARWIAGVLQRISPRISFPIQLSPERVATPWKTGHQEPSAAAFPQQEHTSSSIIERYDEADGEVLILGEPGSGKTVLLLELAQELLRRCHLDATLPVPVIFPLASWAENKRKLEHWLVEELQFKYQVPLRQAQAWIDHEQILPLLDGLDECAAPEECVEAINDFRQKHGFLPLVVCCRTGDYDVLPHHLVLGQAVVIQPLTAQHIATYLHQGGEAWATLRQAFQDEPALHEMLANPLMLSIFVQNTQGLPPEKILDLGSSSEIVLARFVERLLHTERNQPYPAAHIRTWLSWLAWQMQQHAQTELYLEHLQPTWLAQPQDRQRYQRAVSRIVMGWHCLVSGALVAWLKGGLKNGIVGSGNGILGLFGGGTGNRMLGWMAPGIGGGSQGGASLVIMLSIAVWLVAVLIGSPSLPRLSPRVLWRGIRSGTLAGFRLGIPTSVLVFPLFLWRGGFSYGFTYSLGIGFLLGTLMGLMRGMATGLRDDPPPTTTGTWADRLTNALTWSACGALGFALVEEMLQVNQRSTLIYGCVVALFFFLAYGFGGSDMLFTALAEPTITPTETVSWDWRALFHHVRSNALHSLMIALVIGLSVSVVIAGMTSLFFRSLTYGVPYGLVFGTISGLLAGMTALLTTLLKSGWTGSRLRKEQHIRPNEGMVRSARNALISACCFAPLGGLAGGLACSLGFGLLGRLPTWPVMALAFAVMLTLAMFVLFFLAHGGIAWIQHLTLRWSLFWSGSLPLNFVRFLNHAAASGLLRRVGGGYLFAHHQVLTYFARLHHSPDQPD